MSGRNFRSTKAGSAICTWPAGPALVNGHRLGAGDALLYADEDTASISEGDGAEVLVLDLPPA